MYKEAVKLMEENGITPSSCRPKRVVKRKNLDNFFTESTTGQRDEISSSEMMSTRLFFPIIDRMFSEMRTRFAPQNEAVMLGVGACSPSSSSFLEIKPLRQMASHYKLELFDPEVAVAKNFIKSLQQKEEKMFNMEKVHRLLDEDAFPTLKRLFQVALTIPVTSCSCERSFSCLRRVKTWLRTKMSQDRLDFLSVLAIERATYTACTDDELVTAFNSLKRRRELIYDMCHDN